MRHQTYPTSMHHVSFSRPRDIVKPSAVASASPFANKTAQLDDSSANPCALHNLLSFIVPIAQYIVPELR